MRVLISGEGDHEPKGQHFMVVDGHALLVDLSAVKGALHDPTIARTTWGIVRDGTTDRPGGFIVRRDGHRQPFFDKALLRPYLDVFNARRAAIAAEQAAFKDAEATAKAAAARQAEADAAKQAQVASAQQVLEALGAR